MIVGLTLGAVAGGAFAYLFLTKAGNNVRDAIGHQLRDGAKNVVAGVISDKTSFEKKTVKKVADHLVK